MAVTRTAARELAAALDIDPRSAGICLACLWFVADAVRKGDPQDVGDTVADFAETLWAEGLALPAARALEEARRRRLPHVEAAIADVARRGARSVVVRAIVRRLGELLLAEMESSRGGDLVPLQP